MYDKDNIKSFDVINHVMYVCICIYDMYIYIDIYIYIYTYIYIYCHKPDYIKHKSSNIIQE